MPSIHLSIILSLLLFINMASTSSLARYFKVKKIDYTEADGILKRYQHLWPSDATLNSKTLRENLEKGDGVHAKLVFNVLGPFDLDKVLDAALYPSCTGKMLNNFKLMAMRSQPPGLVIMLTHSFIHQPWSFIKEVLMNQVLALSAGTAFFLAAGVLVAKAIKHKQFALIKTVYDAVYQDYLHVAVGSTLITIYGDDALYSSSIFKSSFGVSVPQKKQILKSCILNDPGKYFAIEIFRKLDKIKQSTAPTKEDPLKTGFLTIFEHPFAENQNFAKLINLLLSDKSNETILSSLMDMAGTSDLPALREHISKDLQGKFLGHFGVKITDDLDSAWSKIVLKKRDRHEEWYKEHATPILMKLQQLNDFLLPVLHPLISEYAAT